MRALSRDCLLPLLVLLGLSRILFASPGPPEGGDQGEDVPPAVSSPYLTWQFPAPPEKVREELQALMKEDGLSIKEENRETGSFVTDMVVFDGKRFGANVSIAPPRATPQYPWLQAISMTSGRYGLEGKISAAGTEQTRLDLRCLLEIRGLNSKVGGVRWVPRYSNGTVEHQYFSRLGLRLLPPPAGERAPR